MFCCNSFVRQRIFFLGKRMLSFFSSLSFLIVIQYFLKKTYLSQPWHKEVFIEIVSYLASNQFNLKLRKTSPPQKKNLRLVSFWCFFINNLFYLINHRYKASYIITIHTQKSHKNIILRKCSLKFFNFSIIIMIRIVSLFTRFLNIDFLVDFHVFFHWMIRVKSLSQVKCFENLHFIR